MKDLKETIDLMISDDYRDRLKAEYQQTKIRYERLKNICNRMEAANAGLNVAPPENDCRPYWLLREQQKRMGKYLHTLELRALVEGIELEV